MTTQTLSSAPPAAGTAGAGGRLPLLDVLRGAAILGTLMTNVWIFAAPGSEWGVLTGATGSPSFDSFPQAVESVLRLLANGKFLALLTVLFGVGLAIQYASAERRGQPWPGRYNRRALFLFFEGTVHFVLIFAWDVLMGYAVTALLVARLLTRSVTAQNRVMWWLGGLHVTVMLAATAFVLADSGTDGDGGGAVLDDGVRELYAHGSWGEQIVFRLENALALRMEPVLTFPLLVFLFLLGVRLFRAGAFGPDATGRRIRARLLVWGLGLGLPISVLSSVAGPELFLLDRYIGGPLTALGYLGLIGAIVDRIRRPGPLMNGLTSVGRTALSGYVLQNVLCMLAAYGLGLGLTERLGGDWHPWWVIALWTAVCATLMLGSSWWLRRFSHGPLEQVQRWALRR
ncbi:MULTISPECIES: DUF418 domain-containing protein [Streptomyces]|uniref:DUF418 domain-containing protein n=1 Tax=Streptomyces tsukubensis (strain DSM 42081 / NBRC 108919 / NRRL 18488 / 9993) TaxID=1114943 RepID=A0A7G3UML3_STRT9|nr:MULTISPECIES: DUF418 domain-containing protein [Streptomyces]AZK98470.1 hypothetical protein B7R87_15365 [Streptomyces tsukubensis]MYS64114.1 DUF418 domain-containing protein [Streptomyces sp. SID5473]QKM71693.1 DUF418 domain-containing protein [Streptomyces tsukubensis NRRL18488]TAI43658.1 DUF418 domain-containing protein [Streptomyces tsukubensis]